jgi:hypothetical protein
VPTENANPKTKDKYKKIFEVIRDHGYPIERHFYETEDGYINCVHRISGPRGTNAYMNAKNPQAIKKPVILYQHGLMDSSAGICIDGLDSMAFFFADRGFDVWMNNSRGNRNSKQHVYLDANEDDEFWEFSFTEMGRYDQPALIDLVL